MKEKLSLFSLTLLIVAAIDSVRTLPSTAFFGSSLIFFFLLSALIFLIPISLISAEFSSRYPEEGGIFHWVRKAFGDKIGMLAVWLQWINTMVWYPTMLLFIAGTAAHLLDPSLAQDKTFLISMTLATFWGLTLLNFRGIQVSARLNAFCGILGTLLPMLFLIILGIFWALSGNPLSISFSPEALLPSLANSETYGVVITIMTSFLGMELAGVYVTDIINPQKNFPKAIAWSALILLTTLIFGSLSVAAIIPKSEIHFVDGVMQTFTLFFNALNIPRFTPILAFLVMIGSIGGSVNWLLSPAKGLLQAAEYGFLPPYFAVQNKHGVSVRILVLQAFVVTLFSLATLLIPSINAYYWFLMALSTSLYMLTYILLFLSALKLKRPDSSAYQIPKGFRTLSCFLGLGGCLATIVIGFQPTAGMESASTLWYGTLIALGFISMIAPVLLLWKYKKNSLSKNNGINSPPILSLFINK